MCTILEEKRIVLLLSAQNGCRIMLMLESSNASETFASLALTALACTEVMQLADWSIRQSCSQALSPRKKDEENSSVL